MSKTEASKKQIKHKSIKKTFLFMLKTVWQNKRSMYFFYLLRLFTQILQKVLPVLLPKFILDELVAGINSGDYIPHVKSITGGLLMRISLLQSGICPVNEMTTSAGCSLQDISQNSFTIMILSPVLRLLYNINLIIYCMKPQKSSRSRRFCRNPEFYRQKHLDESGYFSFYFLQ